MNLEGSIQGSLPIGTSEGIKHILYYHKFDKGQIDGTEKSMTLHIFMDFLREHSWIDEENVLIRPFDMFHQVAYDRQGDVYFYWVASLRLS